MIVGEELGEFARRHPGGCRTVRFASARGDADGAGRIAHEHHPRHTLVIGDRDGNERTRGQRCLCGFESK